MDFKEAVGAIVAGIVLLIPAVKWLIHDWAKKSRELEAEKKLNTNSALNRLNDDVKGFRTAIDTIQVEMKKMETVLAVNTVEMKNLKERLDEAKRHVEDYAKGMNGQIKNMIKTEVSDLTKQLMLIRNKKSGV